MDQHILLCCSTISPAATEIKTCKVTVDGSFLRLQGAGEGIYTALKTISEKDLASIDEIKECSPPLSAKKVNTLLRETKIERFNVLLLEELKKHKITPCPINRLGYMPFPQNTRKTTVAHQTKDASLIAKCINTQGEDFWVCRYCKQASMQRSIKERGE